MTGLRKILGVVSLSCFAIAPAANAALEKAAGKANTSASLAHTAANAWALETDPTETELPDGTPIDSTYYAQNGLLNNTYDTSQFYLNTDSHGDYALGASVQGLNDYEVTSFKVLFYGQDEEDNYSSGYPYIEVDTDPTTGASVFKSVDNGIGDAPNLTDPKGEVDDIAFNIIGSDDPTTYPSILSDPIFFKLELTSYTDPPVLTHGLNTVFAGDDSFITIINPDGDTSTTSGPDNITESDAVPVPEPASMSLLAACMGGLLIRRRPTARN